MKRFISVLLVALLVATMVPAQFALASDVTEKNVMTYEMKGSVFGLKKATGVGNITDYSNTNFAFKVYGGFNNTHWIENGIIARPKAKTNGVTMNGFPYVLFTIDVNKSGIYTPQFDYVSSEYGAVADIYVIAPSDDIAKQIDTLFAAETLVKTDVQDQLEKVVAGEGGIKLGRVDTTLPVVDNADYTISGASWSSFSCDTIQTATFDDVTLPESGKYYFFVNAISVAKFYEQDTAKYFANLVWTGLKFTEVIPASVEISADKTSLAPNETANVTSVVTGDNGKVIADTVTYSSSAPSVASVDSATGVVTAKGYGEATITATTSNGKTDSVKITVADVKSYVFTRNSLTQEFIESFKVDNKIDVVFDKEGKNDGSNYENIKSGANAWDMLNAYGVQTLRVYTKNFSFRMSRGAKIAPGINGITYKINVPEAGKYKLGFNYFENSLGLKTGVWLVDEKMLAEKNITMAGTGSGTGCRLVMKNFEPDIEVDTYNKQYTADDSDPSKGYTPVVGNEEYNLAAGEYYIVIGATGISFDNSKTGDADGNDGTNGAFSYIIYEGIDLVKVGNYVAPEVPTFSDKVSFYVGETVKGAVTGSHEAAYKYELSVGEEVSLTAAEKIGDYTFVGWKNSAGVLVSTNASETFTIYTNTFLTAVYDKKADENETSATVEFWNRSGNLIKSVEVTPGTEFGTVSKPKATLNGFGEASGWSVSDETKIYGTVRAVALYDYEDTGVDIETVIINDEIRETVTINGADVEDPLYNKKITPTLSGATYWTRNAKTVAFGESFTHYIFNAANGTAIVGHKGAVTVRPVIALDTNSDGYSMIEYDAAGKTIVEAGIIYGPNKDITVGSCVTKATVKNIKSHGQFVACPNPDSSLDQSVARGYIIYRDGSSFRVVYSD